MFSIFHVYFYFFISMKIPFSFRFSSYFPSPSRGLLQFFSPSLFFSSTIFLLCCSKPPRMTLRLIRIGQIAGQSGPRTTVLFSFQFLFFSDPNTEQSFYVFFLIFIFTDPIFFFSQIIFLIFIFLDSVSSSTA